MSSLAQEFNNLFKGLRRAYGTYDLRQFTKKGNKKIGKPRTIHEPVTDDLWSEHLGGERGIGIVPIQDNNTCFFGAIDIDIYDLDFYDVAGVIYDSDLPLIPCRTKSGGIHCYFFVEQAVPAVEMRDKLASFSAMLGFGDSEIFPKQNEILADRGDIGNWINMPYFNAHDTDRYAIDENGHKVNVNKFLELAKSTRLTKKEFDAYSINIVSDISDGPPCLQVVCTKGVEQGMRNEVMFMIGLYLKKKYPNKYTEILDDYNNKYMEPPLRTSEIMTIDKSLKGKDYHYKCSIQPFQGACDKATCRMREFGIGELNGMPELTGLTKFNSTPPLWFLNVDNGKRIELTTEELQSQQRFQKRCMESLNSMPPGVKANIWQKTIQKLMESLIIIEAPTDASAIGMLLEYLERFCTGRAKAKNINELLMQKPYTEDGSHYFRLIDFMSYLEKVRFKEFKVHKVASILREYGGESKFMHIKNKGVNVWKFPEFAQQTEEFEITLEEKEDVF